MTTVYPYVHFPFSRNFRVWAAASIPPDRILYMQMYIHEF